MKKLQYLLAALAAAVAGCTSPAVQEQKTEYSNADLKNAAVLVQTMNILNQNYVDQKKVSMQQLFDAAISGMVSDLDPYSGYEKPNVFKQQQGTRDGELCGIGVTMLKPKGKYLYIVSVIPDSPAEKAKIQPGSNIVSIDGKPLKNRNLQQCRQLISGPEGSRVKLSILHQGKISEKTLIRRKIIAPSVSAVKMLPSGIGYIKINSFTLHTSDEFSKAMQRLKRSELRALIIDLRNNSGGHVRSTIQTVSQLLDPGKVILTAHRRDHSKTETLYSKKYKLIQPDTRTPLILLVNSFTASSAEIFSGALQDHARAELVGTRTFGKGTLLHVVKLINGGALRFSSGRYRTPSGRRIEGKGLQPDHTVMIPALDAQRLILQSRRFPGEVKPAEKNTLEDKQLKFAIDRLKKVSADVSADESLPL